MTWGELLTYLLVILGFYYIIVTKMRRTERGKEAINKFNNFLRNLGRRKEEVKIDTGVTKQWIPPEKII